MGVFTIDPEGKCTFANTFWEEFLGRPLADLLGYGYLSSFHPEDRADLENRWHLIVSSGNYRVEHRFVTADGTVRWVRIEGRGLRDASGELLGFIGALTDIEN
ncbi:MAG: PAS domain-containing protein, partial [Myxococcota bacterium]